MLALADVAVVVSDKDAAARWWQEKFGFGVHTVGETTGHALLVAPPGDAFVLHLCQGFAPVEPGNTGIAFITDEIVNLVERLDRAGVKIVQRPSGKGFGDMAQFEDLDGNVFWLVGAPTAFIRAEAARRAPPAGRGTRRSSKSRRSSSSHRRAK